MLENIITIHPEMEQGGTVPSTAFVPLLPRKSLYIKIKTEKFLNVEFTSIIFSNYESIQTLLLSEDLFRKDWDTPEEDEAWAHL